MRARKNYYQQALYFSKIAEDIGLVISADISLSSTFCYGKNPVKAAEIYQRALEQAEEILPLQRTRLHAELAVVYAQQKREQDALTSLGCAQDLYPDHPETDPSFFYADFTPASMILETGLTHLALTQHFPDSGHEQDAWNSFAQIEKLQTENTVPELLDSYCEGWHKKHSCSFKRNNRYTSRGEEGLNTLQVRFFVFLPV